jgi:inositol-pentakisphosphate 2-kinase
MQALDAWSQESLLLPANSSLMSIKSKFISSLLPYILHTPLLSHISKLQQCLDSLDCEGFAKLAMMESAGLDNGRNVISSNTNFTEPSMEDWELFVSKFLSLDCQKYFDFCTSNLHYHMLAYILSATFKDCSLMIPLCSDKLNPKLERIKVIDLGIKSIHKIPSWLELDKAIITEYVKVKVEMRKICIEG